MTSGIKKKICKIIQITVIYILHLCKSALFKALFSLALLAKALNVTANDEACLRRAVQLLFKANG